jgi:hypothetical protein
MTSIFCDDVRLEHGNKLSYMGIYNGTIQLPMFPVMLAKLCVVMTVHCPGIAQVPASLVFNLYKDETLLHQMPIEMSEANSIFGQEGESTIPEDKRLSATSIMQIIPLQFTEPCKLKARAVCDGVELKGGTLVVELAQPPHNQNTTNPPQLLPTGGNLPTV